MIRRRELALLRAIYQLGTVTAAAASINMTQPAASALLSSLETRLGFALFTRQNRRLQLTEKGRALVPEVLNALAGMEAVDNLARELRSGATSRLSIGSVAIATSSVLPRALAAVRQRHPGVVLAVRPGTALEIIDMAVDHRIDLGLIVGAPTDRRRVNSVTLAPMSLYAIMRKDHPWMGREDLTLADVAESQPILLATTLPAGQATRMAIERRDLPYQPIIEVGQSSAACALAAEGLGVAVVETLGAHYARRQGLVARHLLDMSEVGLGLVWSHDRPLSAPAATLRAALEAESARIGGRH